MGYEEMNYFANEIGADSLTIHERFSISL
jgi:hypothetical protein